MKHPSPRRAIAALLRVTGLWATLLAGMPLAHAEALRLHVDAASFGASEQDITRLLQSAGRELCRHFRDMELEPIMVVRDASGPITLYDRNERKEIVVRLDTGETCWAQDSYQWSHELCHILCRYRRGGRENKWFEETLCELASLYVMRRMSETWAENPPYPNWREYRHALRSYVDDVIASRTPLDLDGLAEFYREHEAELRQDPVNRDLNGSMAVALLPLFEATPEHWEAIWWLNAATRVEPQSFSEYLQAWRHEAPERHRPFIERLAEAFGQSLESADCANGHAVLDDGGDEVRRPSPGTTYPETRLAPLLRTASGEAINTPDQWKTRRAELKREWLEFLGPLSAKHLTRPQAVPPAWEVLESESRPGRVRDRFR